MNDRELLEMAAKAAGYDGVYMSRNGCQEQGLEGSEGISIKGMPLDGGWRYWNPLIDDSDALRLAVKLGIRILHPCVESASGYPNAVCAGTFYYGEFQEMHEDNKDSFDAARRAIVRAAAEIGKAMP